MFDCNFDIMYDTILGFLDSIDFAHHDDVVVVDSNSGDLEELVTLIQDFVLLVVGQFDESMEVHEYTTIMIFISSHVDLAFKYPNTDRPCHVLCGSCHEIAKQAIEANSRNFQFIEEVVQFFKSGYESCPL